MRRAAALLVGVLVAPGAFAVCVTAEGSYSSIALNQPLHEQLKDGGPEKKDQTPPERRFELKGRAEKMADAMCNNSAGLFSKVNIVVHPDGTQVELTALSFGGFFLDRKTLLTGMRTFGIDLHIDPALPAYVLLIPLRIGGVVEPLLVAKVHPGKERNTREVEFLVCNAPQCAPAAK